MSPLVTLVTFPMFVLIDCDWDDDLIQQQGRNGETKRTRKGQAHERRRKAIHLRINRKDNERRAGSAHRKYPW